MLHSRLIEGHGITINGGLAAITSTKYAREHIHHRAITTFNKLNMQIAMQIDLTLPLDSIYTANCPTQSLT